MYKWFVLFILSMYHLAGYHAQSKPLVEVEFSTAEVSNDQTIYADVYIRHVDALAGADIGISVNDTCLKIINRHDGNLLPSTFENGGLTPLDELSETETRFAVSIVDLSRIANDDGVFYRVELESTCDEGVGTLDVTFATLVSLENPDDPDDASLISYTLESGTLDIQVSTVSISPDVMDDNTEPQASEPIPEIYTATWNDQSIRIIVAMGLLFFGLLGLMVLMILQFEENRPTDR